MRNPAEYRKRAELATPSSIDKDFNFITRVERSITKADSNVLDRGINLVPARSVNNVDKRSKIDAEIDARSITVIKAPKGLSRAKLNKTNWNVHYGTITWTIEWICADGEKVTSSTPESRTLEEAYLLAIGKKKAQKKRKLSQNGQPAAIAAKKALKQSQENGPQKESFEAVQQQDQTATPTSVAGDIHFYLHHPLTISKYKCLIPSEPSQTLKDVIHKRTLLEFPTIYAIHTSSSGLEEPYITLEDYKAKYGADIALNLTSYLEDGEVEDVIPAPVADVDSRKVMEVLAQDLGT